MAKAIATPYWNGNSGVEGGSPAARLVPSREETEKFPHSFVPEAVILPAVTQAFPEGLFCRIVFEVARESVTQTFAVPLVTPVTIASKYFKLPRVAALTPLLGLLRLCVLKLTGMELPEAVTPVTLTLMPVAELDREKLVPPEARVNAM